MKRRRLTPKIKWLVQRRISRWCGDIHWINIDETDNSRKYRREHSGFELRFKKKKGKKK